MYFLHIYFKNSRCNGTGEVCFGKDTNEIAKWTLLSSEPSSQELLRLIATACAGTRLLSRLPFALQRLCRNPDSPLQVEFILALHPPDEVLPRGATVWGSGIRVDREGAVRDLNRKEYRFLPPFHSYLPGQDRGLYLASMAHLCRYDPPDEHKDGETGQVL